jgi:protein gp37
VADRSKIQWTDATWNPVRGCSKVSAGCTNCYAERQLARFSGPGQYARGFVEGGRWTGRVELMRDKLDVPLRWRRPRRVFVNSTSDLFHESLSFEDIAEVFLVMDCEPARKHTFQILTKRPARAREFFRYWQEGNLYPLAGNEQLGSDVHEWRWPLRNVWLGVSVEDQASADARVPELLHCPAVVRFLSVEPLLESVDLSAATEGIIYTKDGRLDRTEGLRPVDWVIIGGESGPRARRCDVGWVQRAMLRCQLSRVPVFVKQLGAHITVGDSQWSFSKDAPESQRWYLADRKGGNPGEWPDALRVREFPRDNWAAA